MTQKRKRYDKQFKIAAARVVLGGEMRAVDLARELGIKDSTLRRVTYYFFRKLKAEYV